MKRILITGVAGLLGNNLSRHLLDKGYDVFGIDDLSGGYIEHVDERLINSKRFYEINLNDKDLLNDIFKRNDIDVVFHFAAYAAEGLSPFIRNYNYTNNVLCSINVINCCINNNVDKLIFTSSMAVYGIGNPPFDETQIPSPVDPYGIAKYTVEQDIKQAHEQFGLNYNIIRPHNVLGVYQNIWDRYRNVIGIWIRQSLNNQSLSIFGDGLQKRAFSDIKYYMNPFEKLINGFDNDTFNIGADKEFSILETANIVKNISKKYGNIVEIKHLEPRHEVKDAYCNHDKAKNMLDFVDDTNLEKLIDDMYKWALEQPNREIKKMEYEINKNMYSYWRK